MSDVSMIDVKSSSSMSIGNVVGYGVGSIGKDLALAIISSYLLIFYTDILGISAAAAGMILVVTKIWDAINDPIMGSIVDRTKTRFGRYRPYVLIVPIPLAVFSVLCFITPDWSTNAKVVYALITYTVAGMLFTAYDVPLWGMVSAITSNRKDSNRCISVARFFTSLSMFFATTFAYPVIERLGGGSEVENLKIGYPRFMMVLGVMSVIFAWVTFYSTKEKNVTENKGERVNIFKEFVLVVKNRNVLVLFTSMTLQAISMILPKIIGAYYVLYYWGRPDLIAVYFASSAIIGLATPLVTSKILQYIHAKKLTMIAMSISAILSLIAFFIPSTNTLALLIVFAIFGVTMPVPMVTITSMLIETGRQIHEETGIQKNGVLFSLNSFATKLGTALSGLIVSIALTLTQYDASAFHQTDLVANGINATRTLSCVIAYGIAVVIIGMYRKREQEA